MNIGTSSTKTKNVTENNLQLLKATTTSTYKRPLQNEDNATKRCNTLGIFHYQNNIFNLYLFLVVCVMCNV